MKQLFCAVWMSGVFAVGLPVALHAPAVVAEASAGAAVRLEVAEFRNNRGMLRCRLFIQPADFPDGEGVQTVRAAIHGKQASCAFANLGPGTYAVAVVHDENNNGHMDRNFLGVPSEGYGVSNNRTYALSGPKWEESKFILAATESMMLRIDLRY